MPALTPELVLRAYAAGLFPMAERRDSPELHWVDPDARGILPFDRFHVPRRLRRTVRNGPFEIRCNAAFREVVRACAAPRPGRDESWINDELVDLYGRLHDMGRASSVETYLDGALVGGLYGVSLGAAFFGESMFSAARDASKVALVHLVARLRKSGYVLLDAQFLTDHLARFGAVEIARPRYRRLLLAALDRSASFEPALDRSELEKFLQSITQTS